MGAEVLSSRSIIGRFYNRLEETTQASWVGAVSMMFFADQETESYKWLGMTPPLREWVGERNAKGLRDNGIDITQKKYESTLEIPVDWLRRDKTSQINVRIDEQVDRAVQHWAKLLSTLVINAESTVCYDGQFFFDTDHSEGDSGSQSNDISVDISAAPVQTHGSTTDPSANEIGHVVFKAIEKILGFKDDQGEPMNDGANSFVVMVPIPYLAAAVTALNVGTYAGGETNPLQRSGFNLTLAANPRLTWTTKLAVFRADAATKPFIRQIESPTGDQGGEETNNDMADVEIQAIAEGSEEEFKFDRHLYGIRAQRNVGYGYWQQACLVTLT